MVVAVDDRSVHPLVLPSLSMLMARRIGRVQAQPEASTWWYRLAQRVMHHPALVALSTTAVLLLIASPVLGVHWSGIDASVLPTSKSARVVSDTLARDFPARDTNTITIAARAPAGNGSWLDSYAARIARLPGITVASTPAYLGRDAWRLDVGAARRPHLHPRPNESSERYAPCGRQYRSRLAAKPPTTSTKRPDRRQSARRARSPRRAHAACVVGDDRFGGAAGQGVDHECPHRRGRHRALSVRLPRRSTVRVAQLSPP